MSFLSKSGMQSAFNETARCLMGHLALLPEQCVKEGLGCVNWIDGLKRSGEPRNISSPL